MKNDMVAIKAVAERGSRAATDLISLESQSLVVDYAFGVADRTAFIVSLLNKIEEYTKPSPELALEGNLVSPAGLAFVRALAMHCSNHFALLQDAADSMKTAYRMAERKRDGKFDQGISRYLDWPSVKAQFNQTDAALESPMKKLLMVLNVVKLAHARMIGERGGAIEQESSRPPSHLPAWAADQASRLWDHSIPYNQQDLQQAIVALHKASKMVDKDGWQAPPKTACEPSRLDDIVEEACDDGEKAEWSSAASEKTRVEKIRPCRNRPVPKRIIENGKRNSFNEKNDTAISNSSTHSESVLAIRRRNVMHRILRYLPFLSCFSHRDQVYKDDNLGTLELFTQKPFLTHHNDGFELRWGFCKQCAPDYEIAHQLADDRKTQKLSLAQQLASLTPEEDDRIQMWLLNLPYKAAILSLRRETISLDAHGITIKDAPTFRIIVSARPYDYITPIPRNLHVPAPGRILVGAGAGIPTPSGPPPGPRPTYIKVNRRHVEPTTLNVYHLPWEWDLSSDRGGRREYMIIKQWIPECDQDVLFEHTRKLREMGLVAPGSVGPQPWPERKVPAARENNLHVEGRDGSWEGRRRKGSPEGRRERKAAEEERRVRAREEEELVDGLLREYTTWNGEGKDDGKGVKDGGKTVETSEAKREEQYKDENATKAL